MGEPLVSVNVMMRAFFIGAIMVAAPSVVPQLPPLLAHLMFWGGIIGLVITTAGMTVVPWLPARWRAALTPRLSLRDAGLIAHEIAEDAGLEGLAYGAGKPPAETLEHFMQDIVAHHVRLWGTKPGLARSRPIPLSELDNLTPNSEGALVDDVGQVIYEPVSVSRLEFWRYLQGLRKTGIKLRTA